MPGAPIPAPPPAIICIICDIKLFMFGSLLTAGPVPVPDAGAAVEAGVAVELGVVAALPRPGMPPLVISQQITHFQALSTNTQATAHTALPQTVLIHQGSWVTIYNR